ncbi:sensor histidine kinase [Paenibacillus silvae]|uniref:Two-component sensor histidine kinase n=1 Tax=Paenibacillus silvae TaxID=1325358 RepID=A0ABQ1Z7S7_9BACL|nr:MULTISPECIES: histidine kinase [Paenibacillus]MCK6073460.1 histidine kinase [Paenibacillus silvae]MCK6149064.1 histidine kinase [Paenibacillus silvae]MCK6267363.1 histidine kinase [Paenibacillus silvae]GGH52213.1 two-component sensor histidine kinase [Paenibacillus silvae]
MFKIPAQSWFNSIFARLIMTYLVFVIPLILLGVYLYHWSYDTASQEISLSTERRLSQYANELGREIEWMELQQFDIAEDRKLNRLAILWNNMGQIERRETLNYLSDRLAGFKNSSAYIKNVYVHIPAVNKSISAMQGIDEYNQASYEFFSSHPQGEATRFTVKDDALNLSAVRLTGKMGEAPLFVIQVELDNAAFQNELSQLNLYPESASLLIEEKTGFAISDQKERKIILDNYLEYSQKNSLDSFEVTVENTLYYVNQHHMEPLGLSIATYLPEKMVTKPLSKFYKWAWIFAITSFIAITAYLYSTYKLIHIPLLLLVKRFKKMEGGVLDIPIVHHRKDEFGFLYARFNHMIENLQQLIDRDFKKTMMMQRAELKQLQSQINPHFLYNSFFILNSLARTGETDRIEQFTNMLGEYFRFITRNGTDHVSMKEEVHHSRIYTEIQQLRFSRRIKVDFGEVPPEMQKIQVPRLVIQPIIENAYEHSLEKNTTEGLLRVQFQMQSCFAEIIVEDNGNDLQAEDIKKMQQLLHSDSTTDDVTGLMNIHRRLVLTFGPESGLFLTRSELHGLKVVIRIQWKEGENECIGF